VRPALFFLCCAASTTPFHVPSAQVCVCVSPAQTLAYDGEYTESVDLPWTCKSWTASLGLLHSSYCLIHLLSSTLFISPLSVIRSNFFCYLSPICTSTPNKTLWGHKTQENEMFYCWRVICRSCNWKYTGFVTTLLGSRYHFALKYASCWRAQSSIRAVCDNFTETCGLQNCDRTRIQTAG